MPSKNITHSPAPQLWCRHDNLSHGFNHYGLDEPFTSCPDCRRQWDGHITSEQARRRSPRERPIASPAPQTDTIYEYAVFLATALHDKHFADVPQWRPLGDTLGVLSQIDNMTTGMRRASQVEFTMADIEKTWIATYNEKGDLQSPRAYEQEAIHAWVHYVGPDPDRTSVFACIRHAFMSGYLAARRGSK